MGTWTEESAMLYVKLCKNMVVLPKYETRLLLKRGPSKLVEGGRFA